MIQQYIWESKQEEILTAQIPPYSEATIVKQTP